MRTRFGLALLLSLAGCAPDVGSSGLEIRDPLGLIDDVYATGNDLRLYVLPADSYACTPDDGAVTPDPEDLAVGELTDAIVDVSLMQADTVRREFIVPTGTWTVLVRGKGTDPVSGIMNTFIAYGCRTVTVENAATVDVPIMLAPRTGMGDCTDTLLSPDEQCIAGEPECGPDCRTLPEAINTTTAAPQVHPRVGGRSGQRPMVVWESDATDVGLRLFDVNGRTLTGPLALDTSVGMALAGSQIAPSAAVAGDGRLAVAFTDFSMGDPDVRVGFYSASRTSAGVPPNVRADRTGAQTAPAITFSTGNAAMVVFADASSATGLSGRVFAAGGTTPSGAEAFPVGTGQTGGAAPAIAASGTGFVVAFVTGNDIFFERFDADGAALGSGATAAGEAGGMRSQPSVAALASGSFLIAWTEASAPGDTMGSGVRGRVFGADGTAAGASFLVNTTLAGDQARPSVAGATDRFLVAFESGGTVRARVISSAGESALNRERPPTFGDFEVAATGTGWPAATVIGTGATQAWWIVYEGAGVDRDIFARRYPL